MELARKVAEGIANSRQEQPQDAIFSALYSLAKHDGLIDRDDEAYLWPENVESWNAWQSVQTQWRHAPHGGVTGLDYSGVSAALTEIDPADRKACWIGIQACERATLDVLLERK